MNNILLKIEDLSKNYLRKRHMFSRKREYVRAVDNVNLTIYEGETLGLVGESGCGKTTLGQLILRLEEADSGKLLYHGKDIFKIDSHDLRKLRKKVQVIFQDPFSSLDPLKTVGQIIEEALIIHKVGDKKERAAIVDDIIKKVELHPEAKKRFPHEFSGGQRQRIGIARALALNPEFIICDEAVSALDVSIQAQILNLLVKLQEEFNLTFLFIAHNLNVVEHISDRVAVMYLGRIVEIISVDLLESSKIHPYTKALISASPIADPNVKKSGIRLKGEVPSPINPPAGCHFHARCPMKMDICTSEIPALIEKEDNHFIRCFLYHKEVEKR